MTPFEGRNRVTSLYGWRFLNGVREWHAGQDIVGDDNHNVRAIWSATRCEVAYGNNGGRGNYVILYYSDTLRVICQHLDKVFVKTGQQVPQGTSIGIMGNTGYSTGAHLHIEVQRYNAGKWEAVPPAQFTEVPNQAGTHPGNNNLDKTQETQKASTTQSTLQLVTVGHLSSGDKDIFTRLASSLKLPCKEEKTAHNRWMLSIGPASSGDVQRLQEQAKQLSVGCEL